MPSWLAGLLEGINSSATANRADYQAREDEKSAFESRELSRIAGDESYTTDVRQRAATALMDIAANPGKRPKGGFLDRLLGVGAIQAHPAIQQVYGFMQGSTTKGAGLPTGLAPTRPAAKPAAQAPRPATSAPAAMPPTPLGQPGGGPPSPGMLAGVPPVAPPGTPSPVLGVSLTAQGGGAQLGGQQPGGPPPPGGQAGGPPPPPSLNMGALGVDEATGAPPQGPPGVGASVPNQIFRTPQEIETEKFMAREYGEIQGTVRGLTAVGVPEADARAVAIAERMRRGVGSVGSVQSVSGMMPDGTRAFGVLDKRPGSPTMGQYLGENGEQLIGFRPAATSSVSMATDREAIASANFGGRAFNQLTPPEQQRVLQMEREMVQGESFARGMGGAQADAAAPLSTGQRMQEMNTMATRWQKEQTADRAARAAYTQMAIGLRRFQQGDKVGGSEAVRVGFEKLLDPSSVVREGEFNRQGMGLSFFQSMEGAWQRFFQGGGPIPDNVLVEMVETARQFAVAQTQYLPRLQQELQEKSSRHGIDPRDVMGGAANTPPPLPETQSPAPGMGQGGPPNPTVPAEVPAGAPQRGAMVGNRYTGEVRMLPDGSFVGKVNGVTTPLRKTPEGRFVY